MSRQILLIWQSKIVVRGLKTSHFWRSTKKYVQFDHSHEPVVCDEKFYFQLLMFGTKSNQIFIFFLPRILLFKLFLFASLNFGATEINVIKFNVYQVIVRVFWSIWMRFSHLKYLYKKICLFCKQTRKKNLIVRTWKCTIIYAMQAKSKYITIDKQLLPV